MHRGIRASTTANGKHSTQVGVERDWPVAKANSPGDSPMGFAHGGELLGKPILQGKEKRGKRTGFLWERQKDRRVPRNIIGSEVE